MSDKLTRAPAETPQPAKYVCGVPHWYVNCGKCGDLMLVGHPKDYIWCERCWTPRSTPGFGGSVDLANRSDRQYHGEYYR